MVSGFRGHHGCIFARPVHSTAAAIPQMECWELSERTYSAAQVLDGSHVIHIREMYCSTPLSGFQWLSDRCNRFRMCCKLRGPGPGMTLESRQIQIPWREGHENLRAAVAL